MMKSPRKAWLKTSIRQKMDAYIVFLAIALLVTAGLTIYYQQFAVSNIGSGLSDISACEQVQEALDNEETMLRAYLSEPSADSRRRYMDACSASEDSLKKLPYEYTVIGEASFARTWNLKNAYDNYSAERDDMTKADLEWQGNISRIYQIYDDLHYVQGYAQELQQMTVERGTHVYVQSQPTLRMLQGIFVVAFMVMFIFSGMLSEMLTRSLVDPLQKLSTASMRMAAGDYSGEDIHVDNQDEVGELVQAFNRMRRSTANNIQVLIHNQQLEEQVHKDELERVELERQLETTRLDLLQSQINPHFLFNTLNTIAGMAELEEAETTRKMTLSLSNIFRYNLHTTKQFVSLAQELAVNRDYLYLQQMRFGSRLQYQILTAAEVDPDAVTLPVFLLQPLVENAVVHGIAGKEEGGKVEIHTFREEEYLCIQVSDTGVGIEQELLQQMRQELQSGQGGKDVGIGLGNICKRIRGIYQAGSVELESRKNEGTTVTVRLPLHGPAEQ